MVSGYVLYMYLYFVQFLLFDVRASIVAGSRRKYNGLYIPIMPNRSLSMWCMRTKSRENATVRLFHAS